MGKIMRNGVQYGVDTADVLSTVAECDASASGGKGTTQVASAKALSELNSNFESSLGGLTFGIDADGNYGYKKVGADTVIPFKSSYGVTKLLDHPGLGNYNYVTADRDYVAIIFMIVAGNDNHIAGWYSKSSCSGGKKAICTYFTFGQTGGGAYLGVTIYTDVPKNSSISNFMSTVYGIYES